MTIGPLRLPDPWIVRAARWADRHIITRLLLLFLILAVLVFALVYLYGLITADPGVVVTREKSGLLVPASGIEGYDVLSFCNDPLTHVRPFPVPDSAGVTYQLTRVRDLKTETVTVVFAPDHTLLLAKHYYDTAIGQQSEPAIVTEQARRCIEEKAR